MDTQVRSARRCFLTTPQTPPKPPRGLKTRGRRFWAAIHEVYELSLPERELLHEACRCLDELEQLAQAVRTDGVTVEGSTGQTRTHPALAELRNYRALLGKLLAQLDLPDEEGMTMLSPEAAKARKAAQTRWRMRQAVGGGRG